MSETISERINIREGEYFPEQMSPTMATDILRVALDSECLPDWEHPGFARMSYKPGSELHVLGYRESDDHPARIYFGESVDASDVVASAFSQNDEYVKPWDVPTENGIELTPINFMEWIRTQDTHLVGKRQMKLEAVLADKMAYTLYSHHPFSEIDGDFISANTMYFDYSRGEKLSSVVVDTKLSVPSFGGDCYIRVSRAYWKNGSVTEEYSVYDSDAAEIDNPLERLPPSEQMKVSLSLYERSKYTREGLAVLPSLKVSGSTDIGGRETNEDSYLGVVSSMRKLGWFVIADGLGGHQNGEVASQAAVDASTAYVAQSLYTHVMEGDASFLQISQIEQLIDDAFEHASEEVYAQSSGGQTTLTLALALGNAWHAGHVGDPRVYHVGSRKLTQLTKDHNMAQKLKERGESEMPYILAGYNPSSILLQSVSRPRVIHFDDEEDIDEKHFTVDHRSFAVGPGELVCFLTDGAHDYIPDEGEWLLDTSEKISRASDPAEHIQAMIREKSSHIRGRDNATVLAVRS